MQVLCGQCGQALEVDDSQGGTTVECAKCGHRLLVPRLDGGAAGPFDGPAGFFEGAEEEEGFAATAKQAMSRKIRVVCGSCGRGLTVGVRMAGKMARCPACSTKIRIPFPDEGQAEDEFQRVASGDATGQPGPGPQTPFPESRPESEPEEEPEEEPDAASDAINDPELLGAIDLNAPFPRRPVVRRKTSPLLWILTAGILVAAAVTGLSVYRHLLPPKGTEVAGGDGSEHAGQPNPAVNPVVPSTSKPTVPVVAVATGPRQRLVAVTCDEFANGGYYPARLGYRYWQVTIHLEAGAEAIDMPSVGAHVRLDDKYESLGVRNDQAGTIARAQSRPLHIRAGQGEDVTFVFEVPLEKMSGKLKVGTLGPLAVELPGPTQPPKMDLAGKFDEAPPRNLRPLLRDPVMAAIQAAPGQELIVHPKGDELELAIPAADVKGTAKVGPDGTYLALLHHDASQLKCQLRPTASGGVILYLADEPFHQVTYVKADGRRNRPDPTKPKPTPEKPGPERPTPEKPAPEKPTPEKPTPELPTPEKPTPDKPAPDKPDTIFEPPPDMADPADRPPKSRLPKDTGKKTIFDF